MLMSRAWVPQTAIVHCYSMQQCTAPGAVGNAGPRGPLSDCGKTAHPASAPAAGRPVTSASGLDSNAVLEASNALRKSANQAPMRWCMRLEVAAQVHALGMWTFRLTPVACLVALIDWCS
jgi:uncharacterized protein YkwD